MNCISREISIIIQSKNTNQNYEEEGNCRFGSSSIIGDCRCVFLVEDYRRNRVRFRTYRNYPYRRVYQHQGVGGCRKEGPGAGQEALAGSHD